MAPLTPCRGQKHDAHPIGTKIHKTFDGVECAGEVTEFTTSSGFYKIVYEDDDSEEMDCSDIKNHLQRSSDKNVRTFTPSRAQESSPKTRTTTGGNATFNVDAD